MKISILLPFKENFSPSYAGAVSLFINETLKISKYKNSTIVYGNTEYKNTFNLKYTNISLKNIFFQSQNRKYVEEFVKLEKKRKRPFVQSLVRHRGRYNRWHALTVLPGYLFLGPSSVSGLGLAYTTNNTPISRERST